MDVIFKATLTKYRRRHDVWKARSMRAFQTSPPHSNSTCGASPVCPHAFGPPSPTALWPANRQGWRRRRYLISVAFSDGFRRVSIRRLPFQDKSEVAHLYGGDASSIYRFSRQVACIRTGDFCVSPTHCMR